MIENDGKDAKLGLQEMLCWQIRTRQAMPEAFREAQAKYEGEGKPYPFFYQTKNGHVFVCLRQIGQGAWDEFVKQLLETEPFPGVIIEAP